MALTQSDISNIQQRSENLNTLLDPIEYARTSALSRIAYFTTLDASYKKLFDDINADISAYERELTRLDCQLRILLTENYMVSAAVEVRNGNNPLFTDTGGNFLSRFRIPHILTVGIGLTNTGASPGTTATCNTTLQANVATDITTFNGNGNQGQRATGQSCTGTNTFASNTTVQTNMTNLIADVNAYSAFLTDLKNIVYNTSGNTSRDQEGTTFRNGIDTLLTSIASWIALPNFTTVPTGTTCTTFPNVAFGNTKSNPTNITNFLSTPFSTFSTLVTTRINQLRGYLGTASTITQNMNYGKLPDLNSAQQQLLYYRRGIVANARVGRFTGSLRLSAEAMAELLEYDSRKVTTITAISAKLFV
jgi:hypothetical protein